MTEPLMSISRGTSRQASGRSRERAAGAHVAEAGLAGVRLVLAAVAGEEMHHPATGRGRAAAWVAQHRAAAVLRLAVEGVAAAAARRRRGEGKTTPSALCFKAESRACRPATSQWRGLRFLSRRFHRYGLVTPIVGERACRLDGNFHVM